MALQTTEQATESASITYKDAWLDEVEIEWLRDQVGDQEWLRVRFIPIGGNDDVLGHGASTSVEVTCESDALDVIGHAMTLRFPNTADAAAFRRGLAAGAIAATLLIGAVAGGAAELQAQLNASSSVAAAGGAAPGVAAPAPAPHHPELPSNVRFGPRMIPE
jgi:hypothetical protein